MAVMVQDQALHPILFVPPPELHSATLPPQQHAVSHIVLPQIHMKQGSIPKARAPRGFKDVTDAAGSD